MTEEQQGCVQPSEGPIGVSDTDDSEFSTKESKPEEQKMIARVGKPAPDFEATAYVDGAFKNVRLSEFKGQWISLCFYPGDFTFV